MLKVSMYMFAQIIVNSVKRDPCGLERWKRFLEGVELRALESQKGLSWQRRNMLGTEWHEQKPKVENGAQELENNKNYSVVQNGN